MKSASIREVQHHLSTVLRWVEDGQEVYITRRNRIIAKIVPVDIANGSVKWPDFLARSETIWSEEGSGECVSQLIISDRQERL